MIDEPKIVLVCGGRDFSDFDSVCAHLDQMPSIELIVHGGYRGADALAKLYARKAGIHNAEVEAYWDLFGGGAGPKRNRAMLLIRPDLVVAFNGGRGTRDMINAAHLAGVRVWDVRVTA